MSYVVSARKYRPQNFDELVGQDHVAKTLKRALVNDQLAHAFLFSGPRGVGKTTSARILARVLNCQNLQDGFKACGECNSCKSFQDNASFNIFELDAASNNSVDHIRALNEQVRFQPQQGAYKIYIIDEVHMLSQAAFNAFLKTLEEPPPYAKFILATTEKHKIIPTILSRCQIFDFKRIQIKDIVEQLKGIADKEGRKIDEDALHLVAQKADGAMRDALSIYDKVTSSVEGDIAYADVANNLNVLDYEFYFKIIDAALKENLSEIIVIHNEIVNKGFEAEQFILGLLQHLRDLLMTKDVQTAKILDIAESLKTRYEQQATLTSDTFLVSALSLLNETDINLPRSQNKRLATEITLTKLCYINRLATKKKTELENGQHNKVQEEQKEEPKPKKSAPIKKNQDSTSSQANPKLVIKETQEEPSKPTKKEPQPIIKKSTSKTILKTPTINADIASLINIKKQSKQGKNEIELTEENLKSIFDTYKEKSSSPSLKSAFNNIKIVIEKGDIIILAPIQIYLDFIRQESDLMTEVHEQFSKQYNRILYQVSEETFPDYEPPKKPKHLTTKEKYDLLLKKNPDMEKLIKVFKLKPSIK